MRADLRPVPDPTLLTTQQLYREITAVRELMDEKFRGVAQQFADAKEAVSEQNKSNALAISKQEQATSKQMDAQAAQIATSTAALNDKIEDVKERMTRLEGQGKGQEDTVSAARANITTIIAVGTAIFGVIGIVWGLAQSRAASAPTVVIPPVAQSAPGNGAVPPGYTLVPIQPAQQPPVNPSR